jgi:hypothetical protein
MILCEFIRLIYSFVVLPAGRAPIRRASKYSSQLQCHVLDTPHAFAPAVIKLSSDPVSQLEAIQRKMRIELNQLTLRFQLCRLRIRRALEHHVLVLADARLEHVIDILCQNDRQRVLRSKPDIVLQTERSGGAGGQNLFGALRPVKLSLKLMWASMGDRSYLHVATSFSYSYSHRLLTTDSFYLLTQNPVSLAGGQRSDLR